MSKGKIIIKCKICGKERNVFPSRLKDNRGKYCSTECFLYDLHRQLKKGKLINCKVCNKRFYVQKCAIGRAKFCSKKCKAKWYGEQRRGKKVLKTSGKNHWNWKGGITPERTKIYFSKKYTEWVKSIYEWDNYTCQKCEDNSGNNLKPHHIESFADYPELRFEVNNGITFCKNCHTYFHSKYGTHHNNRKQLEEFLNEKQEAIITHRGRQVMVSKIS